MKRSLLSLLSAALIAVLPSAGQAIVASIDVYGIDKNGASFFTDRFDNGTTPSEESRYLVNGSFPNGAESGGLLTLNSAWGKVAANNDQTLTTTYRSLLTADTTLDVFGLFSLVVAVGPTINGYGMAVSNSTASGDFGGLQALLLVGYSPNFGGDVIGFFGRDATNGTMTTLGIVPLAPPSGADQVGLDIFRPDANSPNFYGGYAYCRNGVCRDEDFIEFDTPFAQFGTTEYVVGSFLATSAAPEPGTFALLGLGLAGLAAARRRKH